MSNAQLAAFTAQAKTLSYEDTVSFISILLENLKNPFIQAETNAPKEQDAELPAFISEIFAIADKEPELHKSEGAWNREELHRY